MTLVNNNYDLNTLITAGLYTQNGYYTPSHMPSDNLNNFILRISRFGNGQYVLQELFSKNGQAYYMRTGVVGNAQDITWDNWQRIDNYGTMSSNELATLLGTIILGTDGYQGDCNSLGPGVVYTLPGASNAPALYAHILTLGSINGDRAQLALLAGNSGMWTRGANGNSWDSWKKVTFDATT